MEHWCSGNTTDFHSVIAGSNPVCSSSPHGLHNFTGREEDSVKIILEGDLEEIAALVLKLQERRDINLESKNLDDAMRKLGAGIEFKLCSNNVFKNQ